MATPPRRPDNVRELPPAKLTATDRAAAEIRARLSRTGNLIAGADTFRWPSPPYFEYLPGRGPKPVEECLLVFRDGTKATGRLLQFLPDEAQLKFQASDAGTAVTLAFSTLVLLQMLRSVKLRGQSLPAGVSEDLFTPSERQPFAIELVNGAKLQGETLGFVNALCGLFLFQPEEDGGVTRWFMPAHAMQSSSIGAPIGRMLIDKKLASEEAVDAAVKKQQELRSQRLGEYLTENEIVSPEQLVAALKRQREQPSLKLGESLVELGVLTPAQHEEALKRHARNKEMPLGQILADMGLVNSEAVRGTLAHKLGIPFVNLRQFNVASEVIARVPAQAAYRYQIIPVFISDGALVIATENPMAMANLEALRFVTDMKMVPIMASKDDIRYALDVYYGSGAIANGDGATARKGDRKIAGVVEIGINELTSRLVSESTDTDLKEDQLIQTDSTLVKLVNKMILDAVDQRASDIHVESNPGRKSTRVRFRKDGVLVDYLTIPSRFRRAVVSRIKIMSQLDITEHRKPQDGKIDFSKFGPHPVELRVATIPLRDGIEDVVMRVLAVSEPVPIDQLGFEADMLATMTRLISRPQGLFLVCGPTGSGKTTTLHTLLGFLNTDDAKIWTAEDPIEISQAGLRQVQVNAKIGWTFAAAMRSFLRADPDIIMVGEMRDAETSKIGIEASLTGHLVFSTLHTNSAAECIVRLLDLGMDPFNFSDALLGILAQRLIRRLCSQCRVGYVPTPAQMDELLDEYCSEGGVDRKSVMDGWQKRYAGNDGRFGLWRADGCELCDNTGYRGRLGLYELLVADAPVKRLVQSRAPVVEIRNAATVAGMRMLKQDGIDKVLQGLTDIHQVRAVCG